MKINKTLSVIILFTICFFISCSSSDDPIPDGGTPAPTIKSITLSADKTTFDKGVEVTFTVKGDTGADVTSTSVISINGTNISGNKYTPQNAGTYKAKAVYKTLNSSDVTLTVNDVVTITSIAVSSNLTTVNVGNTVILSAEATLSDGSKVDKTSESTFYVNGSEIKGNKFIAAISGNLKVTAKLNSIASNEVSVQSDEITTPTSYTKKAVIEDYTGTWCGWCPRVSYAIEKVQEQSDKVFAVAAHLANGDPMENLFTKQLASSFGVNSFPTAYVNRVSEWKYPEPSNINQALDLAKGTQEAGLAVNSILNNENLSIVVSAGFSKNIPNTKLVVFILEDGIIANQANYTTYYNGPNTLPNFEHNHVLRHSLTNVMGDLVASDTGVIHKVFDLQVPNNISDKNKIGILAMLVDSTGRNVINAQYSKVGVDKDFD